MPTKKEYSLHEAIEAVGAQVAPDVDIVSVKMCGPAKAPILRVFIDHADGVGFDLLTQTQGWVSNILDEIDPFASSYTLEVSSPGPDRPLTKIKHFQKFTGKNIKVKTNQCVENRKAFSGILIFADDKEIIVELDEGKAGSKPQFRIPYDIITSANLRDS